MVDYQQMGRRIRLARQEKGWSQQELAALTHLSASYIGHIERGIKRISLDVFADLCETLGLDAGYLLLGVSCPPDPLAAVCADLEKTLNDLKKYL